MAQKSRMTWVLLAGVLWIILPVHRNTLAGAGRCQNTERCLRKCFKDEKKNLLVVDNFTGFIRAKNHNLTGACIVFLKKNATLNRELKDVWPQMQTKNDSHILYISQWHIKKQIAFYVLNGKKCQGVLDSTDNSGRQQFLTNVSSTCMVTYFNKTVCDRSVYDEKSCSSMVPGIKNKYIISVTAENPNCLRCNNPVKKPEITIVLPQTVETTGGKVSASQAAEVMGGMANLATSMDESVAAVSLGEDITGIIMRETEPEDVDEISFAYTSPNDSLSIIQDRGDLDRFSRSVTVTKEAFDKAVSSNISVPFVAVFRMLNLAQDELNSTILGNEVLTVEMGTSITNLTDNININFFNMKYKGIPFCHSWNGEGSRPNWTADGCRTVNNGSNITCQCSHLTFFAILLTPLNETITASDLNNLTIITQVGCGLSMFFLGIILFMHFLLRRTKATKATRILIHLVVAMFLLNLTFLINNFVSKTKNSVGCKIMAVSMHYFMLATFTWFAVQAFHICLQVYTGGKIVIKHYILKVSVISWVIPSIVGIVLLALGKYGEQVIHADEPEDSVVMCWITDIDVHFIVNIGYYGLVFLFTFTTFIIIVSWLFCLRRTKGNSTQANRNGGSMVTIFGLCCVLGITWGFAFFAYGVLRIPSYYIFTVLNSFQGFFLFIYYHSTRQSRDVNTGVSVKDSASSSSSSSTTLTTGLDIFENPYTHLPQKKSSSLGATHKD